MGGENFPRVEDIIEAEEGVEQTDAESVVNPDPDIVEEDEKRAEENINRVKEAIKTSGEEARATIENDPNLSEEEKTARLEMLGQAVAQIINLAKRAQEHPVICYGIIAMVSCVITNQMWLLVVNSEGPLSYGLAALTSIPVSAVFVSSVLGVCEIIFGIADNKTVQNKYTWMRDKVQASKDSFQTGYKEKRNG